MKTRPARAPASPRTRGFALLVPVLTGLATGPLDLLLQVTLPYPFADLANSPAVWALVAFAVGRVVSAPSRRPAPRWWPAAAGVVTLLLAVEGYDVTSVLALSSDLSTLYDTTALVWLGLGVAAGVVFGTAGAWARAGRAWTGPLGTALAVGVVLAEAWQDLARHASDASYERELTQTAVSLLVLAGVTVVLGGRGARQRVLGLVLALPVALAGALAYRVLAYGTLGFV